MTIGVRPPTVVDRSASGVSGGTVTDAGGTGGPSPTGAVRPPSIRFRPTIPAANAPTPTAPERMRNDRRDQSGISAGGAPVVDVSTALRERSRSMPRTHRPTPTDSAVAAATVEGSASGSPSEATNPTT